MHVVFRESHGLEETAAPRDLAQSPADLVVLSFSDSDLAAFAAGWRAADPRLPDLRLANLAELAHPLSVDTYIERTLTAAKAILIRMIGGRSYWPYGLQQVEALARTQGIALAVLAADGRGDVELERASTVPAATLRRLAALCDTGGAAAAGAALAELARAAGLMAAPEGGAGAFRDARVSAGMTAADPGGVRVSASISYGGAIPPAASGPAIASPPGRAAPTGTGSPDRAGTIVPRDDGILADDAIGARSYFPIAEAGQSASGLPGTADATSSGPTDPVPGTTDCAGAAGTEDISHAGVAPMLGYAVFPMPPIVEGPGGAARSDREATTIGRPAIDRSFVIPTAPAPAETSRTGDDMIVPPMVGGWIPAAGVTCPAAFDLISARPRILLAFYRSYLLADDLDPIAALHAAFAARGFDCLALFVPSLKEPEARGWARRWVEALAPLAIVNATAFSARGEGDESPLDAAGVPVFQVALATSDRAAWAGAARGLSPADLAMHVVLPEVDGRLFAGVASFKQAAGADADLQYARRAHRADPERIAAIADRVTAWITLGRTAPADRRPALILSTYPGKAYQMAHAVGLDTLASAEAILADLAAAGHDAPPGAPLAEVLGTATIGWPLAEYHAALAMLPPALRADLAAAWGTPEADPAVAEGAFRFAAVLRGATLVALQPERGSTAARGEEYHDLSRCPRHGYVAFYLWLRARRTDALIHVGAHGTLEWLPGKAAALSGDCWPEALTGAMPVLYPFIVNDPGEAAQAKRRIGALTIGHLPPPLVAAETGAGLGRLEALLDEFSNADGLDPARRDRLQADIAEEADALGLTATLDLGAATSQAEAITRIDTFVCDVKDSCFGDGLHVFGRGDCGEAERAGLLAALDGRRVAPGPSGSPYRGRQDVLPTGRNLFSVDPRAIPSRSAQAQGVRLADELIRRHLQDQGDYPRGLVVDLWGSATMRTAGEEFAMALYLLGAVPAWDHGSDRVTGVEILPLAMLDRPRIDVTLRVSGLFRDTFPTLCTLFGQAVRALCGRDEPAEWNPFAATLSAPRVYGPAPGNYGLGLGDDAETYTDEARASAGEAWLAASDHALDDGAERADPAGLRARVAGADAFVHLQDLPETDLLLAADYAAHEAGFAAAQGVTGGAAALYHLDTRDPARPRAHTLREEIARVVRARAAHAGWSAGMMRHGFRGAAEIAATLDHLGAFAHLAGAVPPELIDLYHDATLGREDVRTFLAEANPQALRAMEARFAALHRSGLWPTRRNSILAAMEGAA